MIVVVVPLTVKSPETIKSPETSREVRFPTEVNDELTIPGFNGSYKVSLYVYDAPRYIPF